MRHLASGMFGSISAGVVAFAFMTALVASSPRELPGQAMTTKEMQSVSGAGCSSQNGTGTGCCSPCWLSGFGFDTSAPDIQDATNCLTAKVNYDCGCGTLFTCLGNTACTGGE